MVVQDGCDALLSSIKCAIAAGEGFSQTTIHLHRPDNGPLQCHLTIDNILFAIHERFGTGRSAGTEP